MNNFSWAKALGFGLLIWMIMFISAAILLLGLKFSLSVGTLLVLSIIAGLVSYSFGNVVDPQNATQALGYGTVWAATGLLLDLLVSNQQQPGIFQIWAYWLGYALVLFMPLTAKSAQQPTHHAT